ncbi:Sugar (and other) transporter [Geosmithia morbida]|uniref:Sugar (And other) transporter n=1 Tax=Geosmithia morbida TaxID=1094350 RepID=A0A9P4YZ53_9HYPO|nr:Sugar (and other) transporter [Geosmithia morbida]KAF4125753.1 Sugar (and other) transporter [Geosmithia morbida]
MAWSDAFRRYESVDDYEDVWVPLNQAHNYSHSARNGRTEYEEKDHVVDDEIEARLNQHDDEDGGEDSQGRRNGDNDDVEAGKEGADDEDDLQETRGMLQMRAAEYSVDGLRAEMRLAGDGETPVTLTSAEIKIKLMNKAIQDIGMGSYNWQLFIVCGFGWFADNLWLQGASLTLPSLSAEFDISEKSVRYTTSALFVGLSLGSFAWGIGSDVVGRRLPFNVTLLIASVFGIWSAYARTWGWVCFFYAALGSGVGGSLPVDGSLFLEFLPGASTSLLTLLSVWWPIGQLVSSLVAWYFIAQWPVDVGWRYFMVTIGVITFAMFIVRFFLFRLFESPKYLLNQGRQDEAVAVIHGIASRNGTKTWLTSDLMNAVAGVDRDDPHGGGGGGGGASDPSSVVADKLGKLAGGAKELFRTRDVGLSTALIWWAWATIGMGYPLFNAFLPQYFARYSGGGGGGGGADVQSETAAISGEAYRNYAITSICGVPGSLLAAWLVDRDSRFLGRKGTLACSTLVSAVFLFAFVVWGHSSTSQLIFSCCGAFSQNIMYGVLYAYTPEIFPTSVRGAGTGMASFLNRVTGLLAPVLAANVPGDAAATPIYMSAILILLAFVGICYIPIETRGAQML